MGVEWQVDIHTGKQQQQQQQKNSLEPERERMSSVALGSVKKDNG